MKPSLIQCPSCSAEVPTESRFCLSCGEAISLSKIATVAPQHIPASPREVYRADDLKLGQPVALKFLPRALASDPVRRERFFAEVRITRQLAHPNICRVYDIEEFEDQPFLSMEYIDGEDLESLPNSALFCFDDFDATNVYAADYYEWYIRGGDLEEFDCPGMRAAVDAELHHCEKQYIVMDYPFGRDHSRFRDAIDLSVWLETPLDVAMARRILRDFMPHAGASAEEQMDRLKEDMNHYLIKSRHVYMDDRHINTCDLVLDGWKPLEELRDSILEAIDRKASGR